MGLHYVSLTNATVNHFDNNRKRFHHAHQKLRQKTAWRWNISEQAPHMAHPLSKKLKPEILFKLPKNLPSWVISPARVISLNKGKPAIVPILIPLQKQLKKKLELKKLTNSAKQTRWPKR